MGIFPMREVGTRKLAQEVAQHSGLKEEQVRRFLWTNMSNGGAAMRGDSDREHFTSAEAYRFLLFVRLGKSGENKISRAVAQVFHQRFFDGKSLKISNRAALGLLKAFPITHISNVHDGDTWKGSFKLPGQKSPVRSSMRFASYDAPEVSGGKLGNQVRSVTEQHKSVLRGSQRKLFANALKAHLVYQGKLTALLWQDLVPWITRQGGHLSLMPSFTMNKSSGKACGMYEMVGNYGRWLGMPQVSDPQLLVRYMQERLPQLMATQGMDLYRSMHGAQQNNDSIKNLVQQLTAQGPAGKRAAALIDPEQWRSPQAMFSAAKVAPMKQAWSTVTQGANADQRSDISAFTMFVGLGYHYIKYRSQRSPFYERVESQAKQQSRGLWGNALFDRMEYTKDPGMCQVAAA